MNVNKNYIQSQTDSSQFTHVRKGFQAVLDWVLVENWVQTKLYTLQRKSLEELIKDVDAFVTLLVVLWVAP